MTTGAHAAEPTHAYANAPGITSEIVWVIRHSIPRLSDDEREFWLRKAAVFDRMALAEAARFAPEVAAPAAEAAVQTARQLIEYDIAHNGLSLKAAEIVTAEDCLAYVRDEYAQWIQNQLH
ncbi:hypothetical protein [Streptomyces albireticuli]|uniref:hypothetical protein n=1 Tax=Streptomyces albireticuli TaxID=1940 RepID=UPI000D199CC9|nr:hypothetical protein [Streptomyces albireticuli]MCD9144329.1 hypothetical protein [Streptomyces albireticuli]MCD9162028.1 hypothetical protein [Streptomyces albireticuli]MCD9193966.1 hypothetical protein [Streptomyces albireticuli]